jgi:sterol desaturase/sphingolipid hydroxylase (fatty acid hydroxylase superfamily)
MLGLFSPASLLVALAIFVVADLVYAVDHYLVHHDAGRYRTTHGRHHRRYNARRAGEAHLDGYELSTYSTASFMMLCGGSVLGLFTGNPGFVLGAVVKYLHSLGFHLYQHRWWSDISVRQQGLGPPRRRWGLASARYHAFHHSHPNDPLFTYAETWAGWDRLLELAHPHLVRFTADARAGLDGDRYRPGSGGGHRAA